MLDSKTHYRRIPAILGLMWGLCHATGALALGFGEIRILSSLNEPLEARIELISVSDSERNSLAVRVATPDMFERFGITRTALADALNIELTSGAAADSMRVRLTTRRPVREPFLRFLLEADSANGRALREYTVLLDPPGQAPATTAAAPRQTRRSNRAAELPAPSDPGAARAQTRSYGPVQAGDTLFTIAERLRRPGTTVEQMQVALYNENPQAFGGNMDVLLRGTTLAIPALVRITAVDAATARETVRAQRARAASDPVPQPSAPAPADTLAQAEPSSTTTGARLRLEAPRVAEPSNTAGDSATTSDTSDFGRLVEPDFAAFASATTSESTSAGSDTLTENDTRSANAAAEDAVSDTRQAETGAADAVDAATAVAGDSSNTGAESGDDAGAPVDLAAVQDVAAGNDAAVLSPRNVLLLLAVVILGTLLLLAYRRRQYQPVPLDTGAEIGTAQDEAGLRVDAVAPGAGEVPPPDMSPNEAPDLAAVSGGVAPQLRVQDADRQMKIGLFDQARRTLEQGLSALPDNTALQDKLLELDYLAGDVSGFARDVDRFRAALVGSGVRWAGVAAMGRILLPDDPRFAYGSAPGQVRPASEPPVDFASIGESAPPQEHPPLDDSAPLPAPGSQAAIGDRDEPQTIPSRVEDEEPAAPYLDHDESESTAPIPAAGEDSLEDDDNAVDDGLTEAVGEAPLPAPTHEAHEHDRDPENDAENDDHLRLDTESADLGDYDWQPQDIAAGDARQHDRGEDPGMSFELDTSPEPAGTQSSSQASVPAADAPAAASLPPIDSSEFDLDVQDEEQGVDSEDGDAVEIRLDLARMYIEMQDHAAARELLEEALEEGDDSQRENARTLLSQVG